MAAYGGDHDSENQTLNETAGDIAREQGILCGNQVAAKSKTSPNHSKQAATKDPQSTKAPRQTLEEARMLVREMNEFGAKMASDYKGRFGIGAFPFEVTRAILRFFLTFVRSYDIENYAK